MIKNVFFDFNGTLIDDIDLTLDIENKLLVQRGLNAVTKEFYLDNFCFPVINYYKKSGFDLTKINFSELNAEFMNEYTERFLKDSKLFDDVEITLKKLKENGAKAVSLGKRILRTETAAMTALSMMIYEYEM